MGSVGHWGSSWVVRQVVRDLGKRVVKLVRVITISKVVVRKVRSNIGESRGSENSRFLSIMLDRALRWRWRWVTVIFC